MPEVGDIIRQRMISEVDSVAISNSFYYIVKDATLGSTLAALATAIHADWWSRLADVMSQDAVTTCSVWENLNGNDTTFAIFQTIAGNVLANNLPAQQAVVVARKSIRSDGRKMNSLNKFSGVAETLQRGGHMLEYETAFGLENWLTSDQIYTGTVIRNVARLQDPLVPENKEFQEVELATGNPHIVTVPSRQPILCRAAP